MRAAWMGPVHGDHLVLPEQRLPQLAGLVREDGGGVGRRQQPVAARDLHLELARGPAGVAHVRAELGADRRLREQARSVSRQPLTKTWSSTGAAPGGCEPARTSSSSWLVRHRAAEEAGLVVPARALDLGQQLGQAHLDRPVHDQPEAARFGVIHQHDHRLGEEAADLRPRDQEAADGGPGVAPRSGAGERSEQRQRPHPRWYSARKPARQSS